MEEKDRGEKSGSEMPIATTWPQVFSNVGLATVVCATICFIFYCIFVA